MKILNHIIHIAMVLPGLYVYFRYLKRGELFEWRVGTSVLVCCMIVATVINNIKTVNLKSEIDKLKKEK